MKRRLGPVRRLGTLDPVRVGEKIITDAYQYHETWAATCPPGALRADGEGAVYHRANLRQVQDMCSLLRRRRRTADRRRRARNLNGVERMLVRVNHWRCVECRALFADRDDHSF